MWHLVGSHAQLASTSGVLGINTCLFHTCRRLRRHKKYRLCQPLCFSRMELRQVIFFFEQCSLTWNANNKAMFHHFVAAITCSKPRGVHIRS